jgi:hypothetical protein
MRAIWANAADLADFVSVAAYTAIAPQSNENCSKNPSYCAKTFGAATIPGMQASEKSAKTTVKIIEAERVVWGNSIPIPPKMRATMRHAPIIVPNGQLHILLRLCHVSGSCHMSVRTPNSTADPPKIIRP